MQRPVFVPKMHSFNIYILENAHGTNRANTEWTLANSVYL